MVVLTERSFSKEPVETLEVEQSDGGLYSQLVMWTVEFRNQLMDEFQDRFAKDIVTPPSSSLPNQYHTNWTCLEIPYKQQTRVAKAVTIADGVFSEVEALGEMLLKRETNSGIPFSDSNSSHIEQEIWAHTRTIHDMSSMTHHFDEERFDVRWAIETMAWLLEEIIEGEEFPIPYQRDVRFAKELHENHQLPDVDGALEEMRSSRSRFL